MNNIRELTYAAFGETVADYIRFFTPTELFFTTLKTWVGDNILFECGCGAGDTTKELWDRDFKVIPVDVQCRVGQPDQVMLIDARSLKFNETQWPLICRPDHSGWCSDVIVNALNHGGRAIYVGLASNIDRDLDSAIAALQTCSITMNKVGVEGELMVLLSK